MKKLALTKGKFSLVDDEDFYWLSQFNWVAGGKENMLYARRSPKKGRTFPKNCEGYEIFLHRVVMRCTNRALVVDHIDGNSLNNQKSNLRICTHAENCRNTNKTKSKTTSKYKGVSWSNKRKAWMMQITINEKVFIRQYREEIVAAKAYDYYAKKYHGEFANLNFKEELSSNMIQLILSPCERNFIMSDLHKKALKESYEKIDWVKVNKNKGKKVSDVNTGIVYNNIREASNVLGINHRTLCCYLSGERTNKTTLKYL